jgi:hypothetical protein
MSDIWWQLPGPSKFINDVAQDLQDGKNVIVCIPEHYPDGLSFALRRALVNNGDDNWRSIDLPQTETLKPIDFLYDCFISDSAPIDLRTHEKLLNNRGFAGRIIWLNQSNKLNWPAWKRFMVEYEPTCRAFSPLERTVFCLMLAGPLALDPPNENVCLSVRKFRGYVSHIDTLIFANRIINNLNLDPIQRDMATFIISKLGLWDPEVCIRLSRESIENIMNPIGILKEIAIKRDWDNIIGLNDDEKWSFGMLEPYNGLNEVHSSILAINIALRNLNGEYGVPK